MSTLITVNPPKNIFRSLFALLAWGAALSAISLQAQNLPLPERLDWGTTTWSMGGAGAASVSDYDAITTNPAGLVFYKGKGALGGHWQQLPEDYSQWGISSIDGNQVLLTGFNYSMANYSDIRRQALTLSAAYPTPYGSLGFGGQAVYLTGLRPNKGWHFTSFGGVLIPVFGGFSIGAYGKSFGDFSDDSKFPPSAHVGAMYSIPQALRLAFDADRRFKVRQQDWNYSAGGDVLMKEYFGIRGGYHWNNSTEYDFWTVGLSIIAPKIELSGYYLRKVSGAAGNGMGFKAESRF